MRFYSLKNKSLTALITSGLFLVFGIYFTAGLVMAAPNLQINYQGKLTNASNVAVADAGYQMEFSLYTAPSGGTAVWTETRTGVNEVIVENGLFSVMLGSVNPLSGVDFNQTLYLGVTVEADAEMTPRKVLGAVPAAFEANNANTVGGVASTSLLRNDRIGTISTTSASTLLTITQSGTGDILNLFDGGTEVFSVLDGGNVGIGSTSPSAKLTVSGNTFIGGNLTATGTLTVGTLSGLLLGTNGAVSAVSTSSLAIALADTTGTLAATRGGTGLSTITQNQLLLGGAGNTWTQVATSSLGLSSAFTNSAQFAALVSDETGTGAVVFAGSPLFTGTAGFINITATGTLAVSGTSTLATTTISSSTITTLTLNNALALTSGGTGFNTYATGDLLYASGVNTLAKRTIGSTGDVLSVIGGVPTWAATSTLGFSAAFTTLTQLDTILTDVTGITGTGSFVLSASPTFTGTATFASTTNSGRLTVSGTSTLATTTATDLTLSGAFRDGVNASGTLGMILQSVGTSTRWVATSTLGLLSSAITGIGPAGQIQSGPTVTFASSTGSFNGLTIGNTITATGNTITFTPSLSGALTNAGLSTPYLSFATTSTGTDLSFSSASTTLGGIVTLNVPNAGPSARGLLTSADWTTFNGKISSTSLDTISELDSLITDVTGVTGTGSFVLSASPTFTGTVAVIDINASSSYLLNGVNVVRASTSLSNYLFGNSGNITMVGTDNTALGRDALRFNTSGSANTALGREAIGSNTNGQSNTSIGAGSLFANVSGSFNVVVGATAGADVNTATSSGANTFIGYNTGRGIVTGINNTILGANVTGLSSSLSNNIIIADGSGNRRINVDSSGNVGIGTTSPNSLLTVAGAGFFGGNLTATGTLAISGTSTLATTTIASSTITNLNLINALAVTSGGTGATTAAGARTNLGATTVGANIFTLANPGALSFLRINADNTVSAVATSTLGIALSDTTGVLTATRGGTGLSSYVTGDLLYASGANTLANRAIGTTGQVLQVVGGLPTWVATSSLGITSSLFTDGGATTYLTSLTDNLSIGTTSAASTLDVWGNFQAGTSSVATLLVRSDLNRVMIGTTSSQSNAGGLTVGANVYAGGGYRAGDDNGLFWGDSTTGIYASSNGASDYLNLFVNGADRLRISSAGDVAIGTSTSALAKLGVGGNMIVGGNLTATGSLTIAGTSTLATTTITDLALSGALRDTTGVAGTNGMVLQTTGTSTRWVATSTLGFTGGSSLFTDAGASTYLTSLTDNLLIGTSTGISRLTVDGGGYFSTGVNIAADQTYKMNGASVLSLQNGPYIGYSNLYVGSVPVGASSTQAFGNTGLGASNLGSLTTAYENTAIGQYALNSIDDDSVNTAVGYSALNGLRIGGGNSAIGRGAGTNLVSGNSNYFGGEGAGLNMATGSNSILIGSEAGRGGAAYQASGLTVLGYRAGYNMLTGADNNILLGYQAADNLTTGANNIVIGYDVDIASTTRSNQLNIGNLVFGTDIDGTGTTLSSGNIGIGSTSPSAKLTVGGTFLTTGTSTLATTTITDLALSGALRDSTNASGTLGMVLQSTGTSTRWVATSTLGISGTNFFTDAGATTYLTSLTDNLGIGSTSASERLSVVGNAYFGGNVTATGTLSIAGTSTLATTTITRLGINKAAASAIAAEMYVDGTAVTQGLRIEGGTTNIVAFNTYVTGDAQIRFSFTPTGTMTWGSGAAVVDTNLYRLSTSTLRTDSALSVGGTTTLATTSVAGIFQMGTTSVASRFNLDVNNYTAAGTAGLNRYYTTTNSASGTQQFGELAYSRLNTTGTTTYVGSMFRVEDSTTRGNTVRGLEVQTNRGTNTQGENTALSGFARTFGVRGFTSADAGGVFEPAGGYFETGGTTQGNAIRGYSSTITSAGLLSLFQDTSTFSGTGLTMNLGNGTGSFTGKFVDLQVAGSSKFNVASTGTMFTLGDISLTTTNTDPAANNVTGMYLGANGFASINRSANPAMNLGRSNDGAVLQFYSAGAVQGSVSIAGATVSYNAFTGSHFGLTGSTTYPMGTLMQLSGDNASYNEDPASEILYGMEQTTEENSSLVIGSYLSVLEPSLAESTANPTLVMAVGNGALWVADQGEDITRGDYLISSNIAGHAELDPQTDAQSYIIARASEDINWNEVTTEINGVKHKLITVFFENFVRSNIDLALIASSTVELEDIDEEGQTGQFMSGLFAKLTAWFGSAQNGIEDMYANVFNANERICIDGECLTADDIRDLKDALQGGGSNNPPASSGGGSGDTGGDTGGSGGDTPPPDGGSGGGVTPPPGDGGGTGGDTGGSGGDTPPPDGGSGGGDTGGGDTGGGGGGV